MIEMFHILQLFLIITICTEEGSLKILMTLFSTFISIP